MSDLLLMRQRELTRLEVIQQVKQKRLTQRRAADLLGVSTRQVKRLCRADRQGGARALESQHRGRASNNRLSEAVTGHVRDLLRERYYDFGPTLAHEKLVECHGLRLSVESVRQLMIAAGLWPGRRERRPVIHQLRERRACLGELVRIDGSPHDWFEGRGPRGVRLNFLDDATGRLMHLSFVEAETTFNYFESGRAYLLHHGKPRALYSDKLSVFRVNIPAALSGTGLTQFGRAMQELGIELIGAHSPQAKGRVERVNQTLQDRLVKELRLRSISTPAEANAFLPEFAADDDTRFAVAPRSGEDAHRPLLPTEDLDRILTLAQTRVLSKNLTISYNGVVYQVETKRAADTMRGARVEGREAATGEVRIEYKGAPLADSVHREQDRRQGRGADAKALAAAGAPPGHKKYHPPMTHPWRYFDYSENSMQARERRGELCIRRR